MLQTTTVNRAHMPPVHAIQTITVVQNYMYVHAHTLLNNCIVASLLYVHVHLNLLMVIFIFRCIFCANLLHMHACMHHYPCQVDCTTDTQKV